MLSDRENNYNAGIIKFLSPSNVIRSYKDPQHYFILILLEKKGNPAVSLITLSRQGHGNGRRGTAIVLNRAIQRIARFNIRAKSMLGH